ncbi:MAG: substrate-binding domain-containing protein [Albidovulum sp.]|nr:substrate-binding domain-containing protein [Albidovulum sp.]MDE0305919.1 substrate-binding domain-containing protein [Albidovulum sp.]MDE0531091.1 substrate-binding domain-containing protein [Albidovulum sp.]
MFRYLRRFTAAISAAVSLLAGSAVFSAEATKIAFLMPCTQCADRWETKDRPFFIEAVKALDPSIEVIALNAEGDGNRQIAQGESVLAQGVKAIVINTIGETTAVPVVRQAQREGVPVIAYDGLMVGVVTEGFVTFNNELVGVLQAQYLVDNLDAGARIAIINGEQFCAACRAFRVGAHKVLDPLAAEGKIQIVHEAEAKGWLAANAQRAMEQALTANNDMIDGVVAANDTLAQGVIAALKGANLQGKVLVTGQDASDAAIINILNGEQTMTVYKSLQEQAAAAAKGAVALARGEDVSDIFPEAVSTDSGDQPALLLQPTVVDIGNIAETVIKDGFTMKENVCTGSAAQACTF